MRKEVNLILLVLITIGIGFMLVNANGVFYQMFLGSSLSMNYDWKSEEYKDFDCGDIAIITEEYFENEYDIPCYFIYGSTKNNDSENTAHIWVILDIDGKWYEFEPRWYSFTSRLDEYSIDWVDQGFWVDGEKFDKVQQYDNWENLSIVKGG